MHLSALFARILLSWQKVLTCEPLMISRPEAAMSAEETVGGLACPRSSARALWNRTIRVESSRSVSQVGTALRSVEWAGNEPQIVVIERSPEQSWSSEDGVIRAVETSDDYSSTRDEQQGQRTSRRKV
jgi:hypothetical protein